MRAIGILLVIVGVVGIVWGGVTFIKDRDTVDLGVVEIVKEDKERISIPPILGVAALIVGGVLVGVSSRRRPT